MAKHFCVTVYTYNINENKFVFIKHKKLKKWLPPGGHIEHNESHEDAAIREVMEETGLAVTLKGEVLPNGQKGMINPFGMQMNKVSAEHYHYDFVLFGVVDSEDMVLNTDETNGVEMFSLEEIMDNDFDTFLETKDWCKYFDDRLNEII